MPQQITPNDYVLRDSLGLDTIWLNVDALPAKTFNPPDTPELVLFNVDSSIKYLIKNGDFDTSITHQKGLNDTIVPSFLSTAGPSDGDGSPVYSNQSRIQGIFASVILLVAVGILALSIKSIKSRIVPYFLAIFDQRKLKAIVAEESPGVLPHLPLVYIIQVLIVGTVLGTVLFSNSKLNHQYNFSIIILGTILLFGLVPIVRNWLIMLLARVFVITNEGRKHVFISYLSHSLLFLLSLPLAIQLAIQYPGLDAYYGTALITMLAITLLYQLFKLIQNTPIPHFGAIIYIFLYFCTLEILPLILIYKVVNTYA